METIKTLIGSFNVFLPLIGAVLFALPSFIGVVKQRKLVGILLIGLLAVLSIGLPTISLKLGIPFDSFEFGEALGPKILGTTPLVLGIIYPPLLLVAFWFASKFTRGIGRIFIGAVFVLLIHLVLDPATATLELWRQDSEGVFYGVPLITFVLWFIVGLIGSLCAHIVWGKEERVKAPVAYSGFALLLFWTGVNAGIYQKIPVGLGIIFAVIVFAVILLEKQQFKEDL